MKFVREQTLSQAASDLIQFDADSIRTIVSAQHHSDPNVWLADPAAYEKNGRVLRDSEFPRMLAYSSQDRVLYATDGCNSCARQVRANLETLSVTELKQLAEDNGLRMDFLQSLVALIADEEPAPSSPNAVTGAS